MYIRVLYTIIYQSDDLALSVSDRLYPSFFGSNSTLVTVHRRLATPS